MKIRNNEDLKIKRSYETIYRTKLKEDKRIIQGYAVVFDEWTEINSCFGERWNECIKKGAFKESLIKNSILALYNHDFNNVLARKDVNMTLFEDEKGLKFEIELPNTTQANDLYELIEKRIVNRCSFAGFVNKDTWKSNKENNIFREIIDVDLLEITITPIPAYEVTETEVKRGREVKEKTEKPQEDIKDNNKEYFEEIIRTSEERIREIERGINPNENDLRN